MLVGERQGWQKREETQVVDKCAALAAAELADEATYFLLPSGRIAARAVAPKML